MRRFSAPILNLFKVTQFIGCVLVSLHAIACLRVW
ncbi:Uncharacterised protein [Vibrio cholerae]|nr:Uncharacterised protein [Vibrio cholerae]